MQEEPENNGAFYFVEPRIRQLLPEKSVLRYVGRKPAPAVATGIGETHKAEHQKILQDAFR